MKLKWLMLQSSRVQEVQEGLEKLLEKLKKKANLGFELEVKWLPGYKKYSKEGRELRGEVQGHKIFVYDVKFEEAKQTLIHEFIEYLIDQATAPYRDLANLLLGQIDTKAYITKDKVAKALTKIVSLLGKD